MPSPVTPVLVGYLKQQQDKLLQTLDECTLCGHSREDHEADSGIGECWHGSGAGNKCACRDFVSKDA